MRDFIRKLGRPLAPALWQAAGGAALLLGAALLASGCDAATGCIEVSGNRLLAGDLAAMDSRFQSYPPDADFGYPPAPGERRTLALPGTGGEMVCIERTLRVLHPEQIQSVLDLPAGVDATVLDFSRTPLPEGTLQLPRSGVAPPPHGSDRVLWRGTLEYEPGRTMAIWALVRLRRDSSCLRAATTLERGRSVKAADVEPTVCDAAGILSGAFAAPEGVAGLIVTRPLRKGEWLNGQAFTDPYLVLARHEAMLEVISGHARIVLPVLAEEDGREGAVVWVRTVATRERVKARVTGPNQVALVIAAPQFLPTVSVRSGDSRSPEVPDRALTRHSETNKRISP